MLHCTAANSRILLTVFKEGTGNHFFGSPTRLTSKKRVVHRPSEFCWRNWRHYVLNASVFSARIIINTDSKIQSTSKNRWHRSVSGKIWDHYILLIILSRKTFVKQSIELSEVTWTVAMPCWKEAQVNVKDFKIYIVWIWLLPGVCNYIYMAQEKDEPKLVALIAHHTPTPTSCRRISLINQIFCIPMSVILRFRCPLRRKQTINKWNEWVDTRSICLSGIP